MPSIAWSDNCLYERERTVSHWIERLLAERMLRMRLGAVGLVLGAAGVALGFATDSRPDSVLASIAVGLFWLGFAIVMSVIVLGWLSMANRRQ